MVTSVLLRDRGDWKNVAQSSWQRLAVTHMQFYFHVSDSVGFGK